MVSQATIEFMARLAREMPRNPLVSQLQDSLNADLIASPVVATAVAATRSGTTVVATACLICEARRARQRAKMKRYREGIK